MDPVILYGAPHSLYTGKTRAYLRKQGIRYVERSTADTRFRSEVVPVIGRGIIPVVVLPDGTVVQDTVDILDRFERAGVPNSAYPPGARQRVLAHVAELYAVVALTRHAMHFRWSYAGEQERFLADAFASGSGAASADQVMARMQSYLPMLGVTSATIPEIETSYLALLDLLEAHFAEHPYLFGGQPSVGDYGLLGPLFAHLGRDPVPADLMKRRAPKVFRWLERMNASDPDMPEYGERGAGYLPDDAVPATLEPLFRHMADELFPELTDKITMLRRFVADTDPQEGAPVTDKPHQRIVGTVRTAFRGVPFESGVQPYMLYLWQRITDARDVFAPEDRRRVDDWLEGVGLAGLLTAGRPVRVERVRHIEVWGRREQPDS
jgi:glutathione S-transferase